MSRSDIYDALNRSSSDYPPKNPNAVSTRDKHSDGRGNYTPERRALHQALVAQAIQGTTPVREPLATIVGGGPASGKSTLVKGILPENTVKVDVDEIRKKLPEYREHVGKNKTIAGDTHDESSHIAGLIRKAAAENNRNMLLDGTGNGTKEEMVTRVAFLRSHDYRIKAKYMVLQPDEALRRAMARAENPNSPDYGRYINPTFVLETHRSLARFLPIVIKSGGFDEIEIYDNNGPRGSEPKLIMKGGRRKESSILDRSAWDAFLRSGDEQ